MRLTLLLLVVAVAGCDCAKPPPAPGKPKGAECTVAADCQGDLVCNPDTSTCDAVPCTSNAACGAGAFCNADGACVDNSGGGPCDVDENCVGGEHCRGDTCQPQGSAGDTCTSTEQCTLPLVCDPSTGLCNDQPVSCSGNADCGTAAFCDAGTCAPAGAETPCDTDANCSSGDRCLGVVCVPAQCQGEAFVAEPVEANMLIVFDRSGSMLEDLNGNDGTKIDVAKAAVNALVAAHGADIRFGFAPFPSATQTCDGNEQQCLQGTVAVEIADDNAQAITDYVAGMSTCHGTPTGDMLQLVEGYAPLKDPARNNFVILLTDGQADCGAAPAPEVAKLLTPPNGTDPSVKTFVIGFGSGVDEQQLGDMAAAGGTGLPFFQANDAASLEQIFADIAEDVLACDYTLDGAGNDPDSLLVFFNGQPVPRDATHAAGWDYDPATTHLTFAGNACVALQSGSVTDLSIAFGCPAGGEGEGEGDGGEGEGDGGEGEGDQCGGSGAACTSDADCCGGFICNLNTSTCLFLGG